MTKNRVDGGAFYVRGPDGQLHRIGTELGDIPPNAWICRRVADFPDGAPAGAAFTVCARCDTAIAYNPMREASVPPQIPKICMQCADIEPLPFP